MNLILDIGNSSAKLAVFDNENNLLNKYIIEELTIERISELLTNSQFSFKSAILSCVAEINSDIVLLLSDKLKLIRLTSETLLPVTNHYLSPKTLGVDRIAAAVGASFIYPDKDILIIDAGTAINYEFINHKKEYLGGAISPGIATRFKSLNTFTKKLPLISLEQYQNNDIKDLLIGNTSETSMISGVLNGVIGEIDTTIEKYKLKYPQINVIGTGGDINFLVNNLKNTIFVEPNLVIIGLNQILKYNV